MAYAQDATCPPDCDLVQTAGYTFLFDRRARPESCVAEGMRRYLQSKIADMHIGSNYSSAALKHGDRYFQVRVSFASHSSRTTLRSASGTS